ncbi:ParB/RepB/Spo0J family partition protein, partial [Escherichia coli]|nr:ParB/RepB/Spo0J family partition protein [Escherichia coli]
MSVTESKAKTERKSSRKPAKTQETVLSALLAQTEEVSVPLASLIKSPLNVRTVPYSAESVSELADSIKGVGLLQNLVVHALPGDRYGVAAGGRRLAALNMLAERDIIPADWPVRVKVIPQELATAASMTENGHRRDMHPAEQIAGFRAMAQEGKTPAQIGDLLGYSPRHVQRMLKLADLAPVILDALAEDRITTEHCQALALENDTARQVQVFEAACQSGWGGKPEVQTIRRLVTESEVAVAGNSKFRFVGADTFSPDELRTDLFSDDEGGYVDCVALDAALLEKLQAVAEHLREAEGWEWCAGRMEPVGFCREDAGTYRSLPEAEEERLNELMARYDALENQCEESDLLEAEMKLMRCMAKVRAWTPEMRAGSGVVVSWRYGNVCVQRGVQLRSEDDVADNDYRTEQVQEKASVEEISLPLLTKMSSERTLAVQAALMQQSDKSLALLAW